MSARHGVASMHMPGSTAAARKAACRALAVCLMWLMYLMCVGGWELAIAGLAQSRLAVPAWGVCSSTLVLPACVRVRTMYLTEVRTLACV
jgi:hypothetical protein